MSYQPPPTARPKRPGTALTWLGVLLIVGGIAATVGLFLAGQQRFNSKVESLATDSGALSGCITDLTFSKEGTFVLYYLSEGEVSVNGENVGCSDTDTIRLSAQPNVPDMDVKLTDSDGDNVKVTRTSLDTSKDLSAGGVAARPYRQVTIAATGDYQIEITAAEDVERFAIGLGPEIEEPSPLLPIVVGVVGIALGVLLIVLGAVRRSASRRVPPVAVAYGYQAPGGFQAPGQYPVQPPVVYQPPSSQGFDHPTQSMPPIVTAPEPVGPFTQPYAPPPDYSEWSAPKQPLPPPAAAPPPRGPPAHDRQTPEQ